MENTTAVIKLQAGPKTTKNNEQSEENPVEEDDTTKGASCWNALYSFVVLAACVMNASVLTLVPRKNSILYPEYWYEGLFCVIIGVCVRYSAVHILELFIFTRIHSLRTIKHFAKVFIICSLSFAIPYCVAYVTWTFHMGYNHPLPFVGLFIVLADLVACCTNVVALWFSLPNDRSAREDLQKKVKVYMVYAIWFILQNLMHEILSVAANSSVQWAIILLLPLTRILCTWVALKIIQKIPETNNEEINFLVMTVFMISYTSYTTARLSSLNQTTVYGLLIVEMVLHVHDTYQIIRQNIRVEGDTQSIESGIMNSNRITSIQKLAMSEFTEAVLPFAFAIAFTMAYYGPNASLMTGIGNSYFGGNVMEDVQHYYIVLFQMVAVDGFAMVISAVSLSYFCHINLFQAFCNMMKKYWMIFLLHLPSIVINFASKDVNFGIDDSGQFLWIADEGRWNLICNAAELSVEEKLLLLPNSTLS